MRSLATIALCALALAFSSCTDSPTTTADSHLGKMSIDEFRANQAYNVWFSSGYAAYPDPQSTEGKARFDAAITTLKSEIDSNTHSVVMVVKPTCSCQLTQLYMPRVLKALDAVNFPHDKISVWVTDNRFTGIDEVRDRFHLNDAPVFIILKNDVEKGRIDKNPTTGKTVEEDLASYFAQQ